MRPLPKHIGIGITNPEPLDLPGYDYRPVDGFHNYHATPNGWRWPTRFLPGAETIDGCSPNLNKSLHCGHLKNLAVAASLKNLLGNAVAMLGASLGEQPGALAAFTKWCGLAGYNPRIFFDINLPEPTAALAPGSGDYAGCLLYNDVVIYRSNGTRTYAAHDLAFAETANPDYYLTGSEQREHFQALGLGEKHLPLGLLLGPDGKKMRSSIKKEGEEANALSAEELLDLVKSQLSPTPNPDKLAWNILAWQFNSSAVSAATKFNAEVWAKPESPGLYITYTWARIGKALGQPGTPAAEENRIDQEDALLLHEAESAEHYLIQAQKQKEPCQVAQFALGLARNLSHLYKKKSISGGSPGSVFAFQHAQAQLGRCMDILGMHQLKEV